MGTSSLDTQSCGIALSVVVPVYRSMEVLPELVTQIKRALSASEFSKSFEIVLVNDCSPDKSWLAIEELARDNKCVRGISLRKNVGQHNAIMAGLKFSRGDIIIVMDDDLQHPPSALVQLAGSIAAGSDVCYTRYRGRQHTAWKRWGSKFNDWAAAVVLKKPRGLYLSSFKAMSRDVAETILQYDGPYTYVDGLILNATSAISSIDIDHQKRWAGEGNYNLKRSVSLWLKMATGSSIYPLRLATIAGFLVAVGSLFVLGYVVVDKMIHAEMQPGWASLIAAILFIGGLQMIFLGILGEYIGRIYVRANNMPQFVIARTTFALKE